MATTVWQATQRKTGFLAKLVRFLPYKLKRLVMLASLYRHLQAIHSSRTDSACFNNLNESLQLVKFPDALICPSMFSEVIWGSELNQPFPVPAETEARKRLALEIINDTPEGLRYDVDSVMMADVYSLLAVVR